MTTGFGWNGLTVAMISRNTPWMIIPVTLFLATSELIFDLTLKKSRRALKEAE